MVDKPIPFDQRRAGLMEYRPCRQTDFCSTRFTVQDVPRADKPRLVVATSGTPESIRPPHFPKVLRARFFGGKFPLELKQATFPVFLCHSCTPKPEGTLFL